MDFSSIDVLSFLKAALPNRFQGVPPNDFEDFIAYLFLQNDYLITQTQYTGDFGADLLVEKEGIRTAIQIKRYHKDHKVSVSDINQIIGAQNYYQCDAAMMITTSDYTKAAKSLARQTNLLLWNWDELVASIEDTFLDGEPYISFSAKPSSFHDEDLLGLVIDSIDYHDDYRVVVEATLENNSNENLQLFLEMPSCVSEDGSQHNALEWTTDSFVDGVIYAGATVQLAMVFDAARKTKFRVTDVLYLPVHVSSWNESFTLEADFSMLKEGCFISTYCYGLNSFEYKLLTHYRDVYLMQSILGRPLVYAYYAFSKSLLTVVGNYASLQTYSAKLGRILLKPIVMFLGWRMNSKRI